MSNLKEARLTAQDLRSLLDYVPKTGCFTWKVDRFCGRQLRPGDQAGGLNKIHGSILIGIGGKRYYAHRLAWLYVHGEWPPLAIDHINRDPSDNRIENLRLADKSQNSANGPTPATNKSGYRGVSWNPRAGKWLAQIVIRGKQTYLGSFADKELARAAYDRAATESFGEFYSPLFQRRAAEV